VVIRGKADGARIEGLEIQRWAHGGDAVAVPGSGPLAGAIVFVPGGVPGDRVTVAIVQRKKRWARARIVAIEVPSPERVEAPCPIQARCGGCPWMPGSAAAQAASRLAILRGEARKRLGWDDAEAALRISLAEVPEAPRFGYRPRMKLGWRNAQGRVVIGFRGKSSHELFEVTQCSIAAPALNAALPRLAARVAAIGDGRGDLRLVAGAEGVAAWVQPEGAPGFGVGPERVTVAVGRGAHAVSPRGFLQANPPVAAAMTGAIAAWAREAGGSHAVELFAGSGALTPALWDAGYTVDAYELDPSAAAGFAALRDGLDVAPERGRWSQADLLGVGVPTPPPRQPPDLVLLDPPRIGAAEVMPWVRGVGARTVILMSCDVATGFRDLALLCEGGAYRVDAVTGWDMFPHTGHQELLARVVRV
jgi:23S rRNA (uracil1939-C5)-methyltransferase